MNSKIETQLTQTQGFIIQFTALPPVAMLETLA